MLTLSLVWKRCASRFSLGLAPHAWRAAVEQNKAFCRAVIRPLACYERRVTSDVHGA
jgi:hypothetical protein